MRITRRRQSGVCSSEDGELLADEVLDCSANAPESTECCSICNTSLAETPGIPTSFCCQCSCRLHNECKADWYTKSYVTERVKKKLCPFNPYPSCRGSDELFGRDADFWLGRKAFNKLTK